MEKPLLRELRTAEHVHGKNGLGNTCLPRPKKREEQKDAVNLIIDKVKESPSEITLVTAGPLTNLAVVVLKEPSIKQDFEEVIVMGGALEVPGNVTPAAEFNIYTDPEAAKIVFHSGLPITLVSLDVTMKRENGKVVNILTPDRLAEIESAGTPLTKFIGKMTRFYMEFSKKYEGIEGCYLHDPLAVAVAIDKNLVEPERLYVDVETKGEITLGKTLGDLRKIPECLKHEPNVNVCRNVCSERFLDMFVNSLKR